MTQGNLDVSSNNHNRLSSDADSSDGHIPHLLCSTTSLWNQHTENDYGLLITLQNGVCELKFCQDANFRTVHPNAYAPASLTNVQKLGGGGSGVAVFEGKHPELGFLVMKHGGDKDLKEVFALATIAEELSARSCHNPRAADELKQRIPEFRMLYISPHHLGEKRRALWHRLQDLYKYSSRGRIILTKHFFLCVLVQHFVE